MCSGSMAGVGWHRHDDPDGRVTDLSELAETICCRLDGQFSALNRKVDRLMSDQSHLDTDVATLTSFVTDILAEVTALKDQPAAAGVDFTALDALVAQAQSNDPGAPVTPTA